MSAVERLRAVRAGKKNVGGSERVARGVIGPFLIALGVLSFAGVVTFVAGLWGTVLSIVLVLAGLRMTQTAVTQRCYVNALLGRDSCRVPTVEADGRADTNA